MSVKALERLFSNQPEQAEPKVKVASSVRTYMYKRIQEIDMRVKEGRSDEEIGVELGMTAGAVRRLIDRYAAG